MFVLQLLESMKIQVKLPITVRVDNVGDIFMANNVSAKICTKHIDIHTKYVNEVIEDAICKIIFVFSEENTSDIMMKNLKSDLYSKYSSMLITLRRE